VRYIDPVPSTSTAVSRGARQSGNRRRGWCVQLSKVVRKSRIEFGGAMGIEDERVRERAREGIEAVRGMSVDGDVIEQLALAHERHADRLEAAARTLERVGDVNHLGDTAEGRTATANYRASALTGEKSFATAITRHAAASRQIAAALRATGSRLAGADSDGADTIEQAGR
jgi:hypothetical protein